MLAFDHIERTLGLFEDKALAASPFELIARIEGGLPVAALERLARLLAPEDAQFKYRFVPKATLERRKAARHLSADEGMRVARAARVWNFALDIWQSETEARAFLFRAHPMLEDNRPVDLVIQSEIGAELVLDVLAGLKYGSAA